MDPERDTHKNGERQTVANTQRAFSSQAKDIQYQIFEKLEAEGQAALQQLNNPRYQVDAMRKAVTGVLEWSMATMYKEAMSKVVEAEHKKAAREYYAKNVDMWKEFQNALASRDHFKKEGRRQNNLVKQMLAEIEPLKEANQELERRF